MYVLVIVVYPGSIGYRSCDGRVYIQGDGGQWSQIIWWDVLTPILIAMEQDDFFLDQDLTIQFTLEYRNRRFIFESCDDSKSKISYFNIFFKVSII